MARYVFIFSRDPFYKPSSDSAREQRIRALEKEMLFLTADHYSIAVSVGRDSRICRMVIADTFDRKRASVSPCDSGRLHISCRIKSGVHTHIDPFYCMSFLMHAKHLPNSNICSTCYYHTTEKSMVSRMYFFPSGRRIFAVKYYEFG